MIVQAQEGHLQTPVLTCTAGTTGPGVGAGERAGSAQVAQGGIRTVPVHRGEVPGLSQCQGDTGCEVSGLSHRSQPITTEPWAELRVPHQPMAISSTIPRDLHEFGKYWGKDKELWPSLTVSVASSRVTLCLVTLWLSQRPPWPLVWLLDAPRTCSSYKMMHWLLLMPMTHNSSEKNFIKPQG